MSENGAGDQAVNTVLDAMGAADAAKAVDSYVSQKDPKENPTQIPMSTPVAVEAVAAALTFVPTVEGEAEQKKP